MKKAKVLILQNEISAYNVEVYNLMAEQYELTIGYFNKDKSKIPCEFHKHHFGSKHFGPLIFLKGVRYYARQFDVVCMLPDFHVISYWTLPFFPHRYKLLNWNIGFRVSYIHPFDVNRKHNFLDWLYKKVLSSCDASIFYMEKSKEFWKNTDFDLNKVFVAPNTTSVLPISFAPKDKKNFLFVGTLYKGKGLNILLATYRDYVQRVGEPLSLTIVGDGNERERLEQYVKDNHLEKHVTFTGAIYDEELLAQQFAKALLCFSPNQAGLSVPKSMGYGVPFVTRRDSITGGEIYHIENNVTGMMYDTDAKLLDIMVAATQNPDIYIQMGMKAKEYYEQYATTRHRAKGAIEAIEFVLK